MVWKRNVDMIFTARRHEDSEIFLFPHNYFRISWTVYLMYTYSMISINTDVNSNLMGNIVNVNIQNNKY